MAMSTNINNYFDIAEVLATALPAGQATYRLESSGKARHWMQRAYKYRLLLQKQEANRLNIKGYLPPTPYDKMKLTLVGDAVEIDFNPAPVGKLTLPDGKVVGTFAEPIPTPPPPSPIKPLRTKVSKTEMELAAEALLEEQLRED